MKKLYSLIVLFSAVSLSVFATHNMGGYISYQHISGFTYEITVTTYTSESSVTADRCELIVKFGDGTSERVSRTNGAACGTAMPGCQHCGASLGNALKKNIYTVSHNFNGAGIFVISMEDPNRNQGIINVPNSIQIPFYIETQLVISSSFVGNNSPKLLSVPISSIGIHNDRFLNFTAMDADNDILSYELVSAKGENGVDVPGYFAPGSSSIDLVNGQLSVTNVGVQGNYIFTVKITECRNNTDIGYTIVDFQVTGDNSLNSLGFSGLQAWSTDYFGRYNVMVSPNDSVVLDLSYQNSNTWGTLELASQSEAYLTSHPAEFNLISSSTAQITKKFKWEPTASDARCAPYIVTFKGSFSNSGSYFQDDITLMVFVRDQTTTNCTMGCGSILSVTDGIDSPDFDLSISPNPIQTEAVITLFSNSGNETVNFIVFDVMGKQVRSQVITNQNQFTFNKNELPTGVYIYKVVSSGKTLKSGKLVLVD